MPETKKKEGHTPTEIPPNQPPPQAPVEVLPGSGKAIDPEQGAHGFVTATPVMNDEEQRKAYPVRVAARVNCHDRVRHCQKAVNSEWRTTREEAERLNALGHVWILSK